MSNQYLREKYPLACLTLAFADSMRFRWDESNQIRDDFFDNFFGQNGVLGGDSYEQYSLVPLELIHSKTVLAVDKPEQTQLCRADGIITCNPLLVPILTVADCMPIYMWEPKTGCFGVLHSGWKGTGIVAEALSLANRRYEAKAKNFRIILGSHIGACCYVVDEDRARYFIENFTPDCVTPLKTEGTEKPLYRLSLEKANLALLEKAGVQKENITCVGECTCCTQNADACYKYGSFRREAVSLPENMSLQEKHKHFTPMAAFMCMGTELLEQANNLNVLSMNFPE